MAQLEIASALGLATVRSALFHLQVDQEGGLTALLSDVPVTGSEVSGTFKVVADAPVSYKRITVTLKGEAEVKEYDNETRSITSGTETFLTEVVVLKESSTPGSSDELEKGTHNIPFKLQIDKKDLPRSQITRDINIKYFLEAHLYKGLPVARVPFTYAGTFDLTSEQHMQSVSADKEKSFLFSSESVHLFAELNSSAVRVGEMVKMRVKVVNNSSRTLGLKAAIKGRSVTSIANRHHTLWAPTKTVTKDTRETHVGARMTVDWEPEGIVFPQTEPTTMNLPRAQASYFVRVRASVRLGTDCVIDIPVTVV